MDDVVLGYDSLAAYINDPFYIGAVIGRYANRIAEAYDNSVLLLKSAMIITFNC